MLSKIRLVLIVLAFLPILAACQDTGTGGNTGAPGATTPAPEANPVTPPDASPSPSPSPAPTTSP
jgi:hypothetical protein